MENYKEGGLYKFENQRFVDIGKQIADDFISGKHSVLDEETKEWMRKCLNEQPSTILPDSELSLNEIKSRRMGNQGAKLIEDSLPDSQKEFMGIPLASDAQQLLNGGEVKGNHIGKGKPEKPEKVMPQGLSKSEQLRWMRENS